MGRCKHVVFNTIGNTLLQTSTNTLFSSGGLLCVFSSVIFIVFCFMLSCRDAIFTLVSVYLKVIFLVGLVFLLVIYIVLVLV